jgi:hypothetical protein
MHVAIISPDRPRMLFGVILERLIVVFVERVKIVPIRCHTIIKGGVGHDAGLMRALQIPSFITGDYLVPSS